MMHALLAAAVLGVSTATESLRNRILLVVLGFAVLLIGLSVSAASLSIGEHARLIIDVGLSATSVVGGGIAMVLTITSFARELERRTAYPTLARPVPRWAFVLGKYLGVVAVLVLLTTAMLAATAATLLLYGGHLPAAFLPSLWLAWLEVAMVAAVALLFSCFTTPVLAALYTTVLWLAGQLAGGLAELATQLGPREPLFSSVVRGLYYVLPDLERLSLRVQAANDLPVPASFVGVATAYSLAYITTCLALAMAIFSRRRAI